MRKLLLFALFGSLVWNGHTFADVANVDVMVVDDDTDLPVKGVRVTGYFTVDIGARAWTESSVPNKASAVTDKNGRCKVSGKTNCGRAGCWVENPPAGYYCPSRGWGHTYSEKNLLGVWQPDNLVATIRLQRVERPIPLMVKSVEWRNRESGLRGLQGTNAVMRFDMMRGDWLPPYGKGEIADVTIASKVTVTGTGKSRKPYPEFGWETMNFYELRGEVAFSGSDGISERAVKPADGLKIRCVREDPAGRRVARVSGVRQVFERKGGDWYADGFSDKNTDRAYAFRIRSRRNENGELVEAYYGKIYGDFEFEGNDRSGLVSVKFLYYLNPTPLDRNLEWDMRNNLCPDPGSLGERRP